MQRDAFGLELAAASADAAKKYDDTVFGYLGFKRDVGDRLKATLLADPNLAMAHCLKGYFFLLFCNPEMNDRIANACQRAAACAASSNATERENSHIAALGAWAKGDIAKAVEYWEAILDDQPLDIVALRLAHFAHFYAGDPRQLRDSVARVVRRWDAGLPAYGNVLGMLAFGHEEVGDYGAAEDYGRRAVALSDGDIWAVHAVAHVHEMTGRPLEGLRWLDETEAGWKDCNNFAYHIWWHRALFHLERGETDTALALYDARVRSDKSEEYLDIANAAALLWRLENAGVAVGERWIELADKSEKRVNDHVLVFVDAHFVMALAWAGRTSAATKLVDGARAAAQLSSTTQAPVYASIGAPLCEAIVAFRSGSYARTVDLLLPIRYRLEAIGGSHAQRDLFHQMLLAAAIRGKSYALARALGVERVEVKRRSPLAWRAYAEALDGTGEKGAAAQARAQAAQLQNA